ncbi:MAG: zinc ribbon domain-containing protein [Lachnospiraceae bacterium]|nr:zinc ribbon domain-containing protein [Lachnospiraceae bacterium]
MNETKAKNILKAISMALVLVSVLMLFSGAMTVKDRDERKELKSAVKSGLKNINEYKDDIDDLQDELDDYNIDINAKKLFKQAKKVLKVFKDAKVSAGEVASCAPSIISLASEIEDNRAVAGLLGMGGMSGIIDTIGDAKAALIAFMVLFYLTLLAGVITIILHYIDSKLPGVAITILNLIWLIIWGVTVHKINVYADEELDVEKLVKVTGAPVWAFILAALALVIWMFKDTIAESLSGGVSPAAMAGAAASAASAAVTAAMPVRPAAPAIICPVCGNALNEGALFCPECGNRYEPPAPPAEVFCTNCGTKLNADTVFCPNCGTKQQ